LWFLKVESTKVETIKKVNLKNMIEDKIFTPFVSQEETETPEEPETPEEGEGEGETE
jgi:hypothetical protein